MAEASTTVANYLPFKLANGEVIRLSLSWGRLKLLKVKKPEVFESYNAIFMEGPKDIFDFVTIIYAAYVCYNIDSEGLEDLPSQSKFIDMIPENQGEVILVAKELIEPSKK